MPISSQGPDPLQPVLRDAEAELRRRLREACEAEAKGVANESAAEIRRLEDALLAAAVAAEHTLTLRRRLERSSATAPDAGAPSGRAPSENAPGEKTPSASEETAVGAVREFRDREGRAWRAWPVTPGHSRTGRTKQFLGDFQVGWICFEGIDSSARRRLAGHPERWTELNDQDLDTLLRQAIAVRERKPPSTDARAPRPDR
jgi:hypothetical protein